MLMRIVKAIYLYPEKHIDKRIVQCGSVIGLSVFIDMPPLPSESCYIMFGQKF